MYNLNHINTLEYRNQRNFRERNRVRKISTVFEELKDKLPAEWTSKKMSKAEILKKTVTYIKYLSEIIQSDQCKDYTSTAYLVNPPAGLLRNCTLNPRDNSLYTEVEFPVADAKDVETDRKTDQDNIFQWNIQSSHCYQ